MPPLRGDPVEPCRHGVPTYGWLCAAFAPRHGWMWRCWASLRSAATYESAWIARCLALSALVGWAELAKPNVARCLRLAAGSGPAMLGFAALSANLQVRMGRDCTAPPDRCISA